MARGALPHEHPSASRRRRKVALRKADCVLVFGTPLDFRVGYGRSIAHQPEAKIVQVDLDGAELGTQPRVEVAILGDTGLVLEQLTAGGAEDGHRSDLHGAWLTSIRAPRTRSARRSSPEMTSDARRSTRYAPAPSSATRSTSDTIVIGDGGDFVATAANVLASREPGHWLDAGPLGTLGVGPGLRHGGQARAARSAT